MPTITKILEQKRRANRRNIYLDGKFAFGLNLNVVAKFRLREGLQLSQAQVDEIANGEVTQECFDKATQFLGMRLHSRSELKRKLQRKEFGEEIINKVLDRLTELNYLDDARFAATKALSVAKNKHHGKNRARIELMKSGVARETAHKALEDVYDAHDSLAAARDLARKKAPGLKRLEPHVAKRRLTGLLLRRGYDYDTIRPVIDEVLGHDNEND